MGAFKIKHRPGSFGFIAGASKRWAFTLLELLASIAVFSIILILALSVVSQTGALWRRSVQDIEAFQAARVASDTISRALSQATLNTYWDYEYEGGRVVRYRRNSELHFVLGPAGADGLPGTPGSGQAVFFQAPLGRAGSDFEGERLPELLNEVGFYVEFGSNAPWLPTILDGRVPAKNRYRLFQVIEQSEELDTYGDRNSRNWVSQEFGFPLADNVIALAILPKRSEADETLHGPLITGTFNYDSRVGESSSPQPVTAHQLPPLLEVVLLAISEESAARIDEGSSPPSVIQSALSNKLRDPAMLTEDLEDITESLSAERIDFRVFTSTLRIKESKWSEY